MDNQQFCLRWNNHQNNLLDVFGNLLSSEHFVDVTLACDGKLLKAHKMVLSACSTFFQEIFLNNPCKHPVVFIKDVKYSELHAIVDFMYHGEVNISQDQLSSLLKTAEALKVKGLAEVGGAEQSNETSKSNPPPATVPLSTSNNNANSNINIQQSRNDNENNYPPSPKRLKTRRFESRSQEVTQTRVQNIPRSPAPSSHAQPEPVINETAPPQEVELEDVKPIIIKDSPKSYTADESNSNDYDMYSSFIEQSFDEPGGDNYDNTEHSQSANNESFDNNIIMDLEQAQSSSSSMPSMGGNPSGIQHNRITFPDLPIEFKKYKKWTSDQMDKAVQSVMEYGVTVTKAASDHNVPMGTLWRYVKLRKNVAAIQGHQKY